MRSFSFYQTHVFKWITFAWQKLIVWGCFLTSAGWSIYDFPTHFRSNFRWKNPENTLLSFKRQKRTQLLKKEKYHVITQTAGERRFCHVIAFAEFFEMPQKRRMLFSVPFLFQHWSYLNFLKCYHVHNYL